MKTPEEHIELAPERTAERTAEPVPETKRKPRSFAAEAGVRLVFLAVFISNVFCALLFITEPQSYVAAYELTGVGGEVAIQGIGIAFLMWNATYPLFIIRPHKYKVLGFIILVQQAIGLAGETWLLLNLPAGHATLTSSILRFIAFDGVGLVLMVVALILLWRAGRRK